MTAVDGINSSDIPVMIIHGSADESVSFDGASIIPQRERITNPNVVYKTCSVPNHNGHRDLLWSEAAVQYIDQQNQKFRALLDHYHGHLPDSVKAEFYAGIDRFRTSEVDVDLMNEINRFFESTMLD
jgi:hypothetical protein